MQKHEAKALQMRDRAAQVLMPKNNSGALKEVHCKKKLAKGAYHNSHLLTGPR